MRVIPRLQGWLQPELGRETGLWGHVSYQGLQIQKSLLDGAQAGWYGLMVFIAPETDSFRRGAR